MYSTTAAAESAALLGHGADWDTQQCQDLQNEILSSSPPLPANAVASTNLDALLAVENSINPSPNPRDTVGSSPQRSRPEDSEVDKADLPGNVPRAVVSTDPDAVDGESELLPTRLLVRHSGHSRRSTLGVDGVEVQSSERPGKRHAQLAALAKMEDFTQKSSMSPTQENSESAYEHFGLQRVLDAENDFLNSADEEIDQQAPTTAHSFRSKHHSVMSESTAFTYGDNDTGHIKLDFNPQPGGVDEQDSQDESYAVQNLEVHGHSYDPQTPAPPINPFAHKGSVLKAHELFGATQPSSLGRRLASPTSSRPSPDVYNDFTSPPQKRFHSSPLVRGPVLETSPLQSSVRDMLNAHIPNDSSMAAVQRTSGFQSSDLGPTMPSSTALREPRAYRSMKESQERRRMNATINEQHSDSNDSDSSIESVPIKRKRIVDDDIKRQLAAVEVRRRMPSSSRPQTSSPPVLVPSTLSGRRADYVAQGDDSITRDLEQEDVIADSQKLLNQEQPQLTATTERDDPHTSQVEDAENPVAAPIVPLDDQVAGSSVALHDDDLPDTSYQNESDALQVRSPHGSLPQELPINQHSLCTPTPNRHLQSDSTVPETSRAEDRIRPIGEVTSFTSARQEDDLRDLPGFTQDVEYENAMRVRDSPAPMPATVMENHPSSDVLQDVPGLTRDIESENATRVRNSPEPLPSTALDNPPSSDDTALSSPPISVSSQAGSPPSEKTGQTPRIEQVKPVELPINRDGTAQAGNQDLSIEPENDEQVVASERKIPSQETIPQLTRAESVVLEVTNSSNSVPSTVKRAGLRTKAQMKGPSSSLRRNAIPAISKDIIQHSNTPSKTGNDRGSKSKLAKQLNASAATPDSSNSAHTTPLEPISKPSSSSKLPIARKSDVNKRNAPQNTAPQRASKRRSGPVTINYNEDTPSPSRSSRHQSLARSLKESSVDPLALPLSYAYSQLEPAKGLNELFSQMTFAVSYVGHEQDRNRITALIVKHGGRILKDGFDSLFEPYSLTRARLPDEEVQLSLVETARSIGFAALIADEHSRKAKYMQALALGLPCISGQWISTCVSKNILVDWTPYLLCAGQSSVLGNAFRSRILQPYSPAEANLVNTLATRDKLLKGKSILLVMGKGKAESRKAYVFLTQALGPARIDQATDLAKARKRLIEAENEGHVFDLLYVDTHEEDAAAMVFGSTPAAAVKGSRKRKRGPGASVDDQPSPKKIRVISDEVIVQSLILGQLLDE